MTISRQIESVKRLTECTKGCRTRARALYVPLKNPRGRCVVLLTELLDAPELGLRLLYSGRGVLDRPIGRLVTTDLLEPGRYLSGGEVVLTGLVWRRQGAVDALTRTCL